VDPVPSGQIDGRSRNRPIVATQRGAKLVVCGAVASIDRRVAVP
jgi:hypothetical protein